ncbi:helix-turn-helix domain-containing protein [Paenibacillus azoreducens]|uniref:helix-turn-helix domain-containing protein n=1 Tax=Paenibacillus azoreducens TaxID=116718 RepID=UPI0039F45D5D
MEVVDKIKEVMEQRDVSQYRLALDAGIPHSSLSALLKGETKNPSMEMISKIGDALHVTTDYLLGKTDVNLYDWIYSGEGKLQEEIKESSPPYLTGEELDEIPIEDLVMHNLTRKGKPLTKEQKERLSQILQAAADLLDQ